MKREKETNIIFRVNKTLKEEFRLYFNTDMTKTIISLMEKALKDQKYKVCYPFLEELKGNRYAISAFATAIDDIYYYKSNGDDDLKMMESVKQLLSEKFEIRESVTEQFFENIYLNVYKGDFKLMYSHKQAIIDTINEITYGKDV
jgi:hypothetical protein